MDNLYLQEKLTFDISPTDSSNNPITSGGVATALSTKADIYLENMIVVGESSDGITYTATTDIEIHALIKGMSLILVPNMTSTSTTITLNVNNLGAKRIKRKLSTGGATTSDPVSIDVASLLYKDLPTLLMYDGNFWIAMDHPKPNALDLDGAVPITNGGTGATTAADARENLGINFKNLAYLGNNPITTTDNDTTEKWLAIGSGYARYDTAGCLTDQPSQYGIVINYGIGSDVFQIWHSMPSGPMYKRSGNNSGWSGTWKKIFDNSQTIPIANGGTGATTAADARTNLEITPYNIGARPLRQSGAYGISTPAIGQEVWWKLGEVNCTGTYFSYQFKLLVISNGTRGMTELTALIRTGTTTGVLSSSESYLYVNNLNSAFGLGKGYAVSTTIDPNNYAIDNTTAGKAVLYVKIPSTTYVSMHLIVLAETFSTNAASANSEKFVFATPYYGGSPVEGTHYETSITEIVTGTQVVTPVGAGGTGLTTLTSGAALIGNGTGNITTRSITNTTSASTAISANTNLITSNTLRYALNRTTGPTAADTNYSTYMMRSIAASTTDLTAGSSTLTSGAIYLVYE